MNHRNILRNGLLLIAAVCAVLITSCANLAESASIEFEKTFTCPKERVLVRQRTDLRASALLGHEGPIAEAPDEIAADPERLALWKKEKQKERMRTIDFDNRDTVFEASGCGYTALMLCHKVTNPDTTGTKSTVLCSIHTRAQRHTAK